MTNLTKPYLKTEQLKKAGAQRVAFLTRAVTLVGDLNLRTKPTADLTRDGFYFIVNGGGLTVARYYVGRQRSKAGFEHVIRKMRKEKTSTNAKILNSFETYEIYWLPTVAMKPVTTGVNKGPIALLLTKAHNDRFQNLEEMNRMLNDNFKFLFQKY